MKYLYDWQDWGIFEVRKVEVLESGIKDRRYPIEEFSIVSIKDERSGNRRSMVLSKYIFDTYDEAYSYGIENCPRGTW